MELLDYRQKFQIQIKQLVVVHVLLDKSNCHSLCAYSGYHSVSYEGCFSVFALYHYKSCSYATMPNMVKYVTV